MAMSYWLLPENALDDPDEAGPFRRVSRFAAALRARAKISRPRNPEGPADDVPAAEHWRLFGFRLLWRGGASGKRERARRTRRRAHRNPDRDAGTCRRTNAREPIAPTRRPRRTLSAPRGQAVLRGRLERSTGAQALTSAVTSISLEGAASREPCAPRGARHVRGRTRLSVRPAEKSLRRSPEALACWPRGCRLCVPAGVSDRRYGPGASKTSGDDEVDGGRSARRRTFPLDRLRDELLDRGERLARAGADQGERLAGAAGAAGAADAVDVILRVMGHVEVEDVADGRNVEAAGRHVGGDQERGPRRAERVESRRARRWSMSPCSARDVEAVLAASDL